MTDLRRPLLAMFAAPRRSRAVPALFCAFLLFAPGVGALRVFAFPEAPGLACELRASAAVDSTGIMPRSKTNNPSSSAFNASPPAASVRSPRAGLKMAACLLCLIAPTAPAGPGSLWKTEASTSMFADKRARIVGDLLTILIQENSTASKDNSIRSASLRAT